jgi:SET domain-containing protein
VNEPFANLNAMEPSARLSSVIPGSTLDEGNLEWIYFKSSPIHGLGGFARKEIHLGTKVIEYIGQRISKEESLRRCILNNEYIFFLDDEYDLDGNVGWNPAKFINHSCTPSCEAELIEGRIWIIATRVIRQDEEVTFNYGYVLEDYQEHPCRCGSPHCVGYIVAEEFFDIVKAKAAGS